MYTTWNLWCFIWQVFKAMNSYDLGCSAGGGADSAQVFTDVGLAFLSDTIQSNVREGKWNLSFTLDVHTNQSTLGEVDCLKIRNILSCSCKSWCPRGFLFSHSLLRAGSSDSPDVGCWSTGTQLTWNRATVGWDWKQYVFCKWDVS